MMTHHNHHLKRLQHSKHSSNHHSSISADEDMRESIRKFSVVKNKTSEQAQSLKPALHRARRGGANGRAHDRSFFSSVSLPKRAINYDLAESFMDHSTNPLSSDLYKIRFKHSSKQWPAGRFINYKEYLNKLDGNIVEITCTRTCPIVPKRKKVEEVQENRLSEQTSVCLVDPIAQEQRKKLADKQADFYANFLGPGKMPPLPSSAQIKKINGNSNGTKSSTSMSLLSENKEDTLCA